MNFLAHFFLSGKDDHLMVGNFLGDYLSNAQVSELPASVQHGVKLHRAIDSYTDQHPEVLRGVRRMYKKHSKYAPVIIDVFYDYFLSLNWSKYSDEPIQDFILDVYACLQRHHHLMPEPVHTYVPEMIADNWLETYGTHNGIAYTFRRMSRRVSRPELLSGALDTMVEHFQDLNAEFNAFFPEVIRYAKAVAEPPAPLQ
ncbi:MAG: ACP phosphodiesterase [Phaeodactylibacter sp.]|uniref:acyl carrier protein phosphodiesterase n=1 Tax=Phaeodactylibacter sp. TaxID=1940289 RepID=UPI0032ED9A6C